MIPVKEAVEKFYEYLPDAILWGLYKSEALNAYLIHSNYVTIDDCFHAIGFDGSFVNVPSRFLKSVDLKKVYSKKIVFAFAKQWKNFLQRQDCTGGIALCDDGSLYRINYMEGFDTANYVFLGLEKTLLDEVRRWLKLKKEEVKSLPKCVENDDAISEKFFYEKDYCICGKEVQIFKSDYFEMERQFLTPFLSIARKYFANLDDYLD